MDILTGRSSIALYCCANIFLYLTGVPLRSTPSGEKIVMPGNEKGKYLWKT